MNDLTKRAFSPDYAVSPGEIIAEHIEELQISAREVARRCGRSAKLIAEIISGKAALEPTTALQLERAIGVDASILLGLEAKYQLKRARDVEEQNLSNRSHWIRAFPLKALQELGHVTQGAKTAKQAADLLRFFRVGSIEACEMRFAELLDADYRTSPAFANKVEALASWLQVGELKAEKLAVDAFDRNRFLTALASIKPLTLCPLDEAIPRVQALCASAGVAFIVQPAFPGVRVSGATRWIAPGRPLIQQSFRHRSNDHFWFTFYHECAHLLLHSRKGLFIDAEGDGSAEPDEEREANHWAMDFLIPKRALDDFIERFEFDEDQVVEFANEQRIAPGIVVGQLQHKKVLRFNQMRRLLAPVTDCDISAICVSQRETAT